MKKKLTSTFFKIKFSKIKFIRDINWFLVAGALVAIMLGIVIIYNTRDAYKVMFWPGKVNQHWDNILNSWATDSDGTSGAGVDKLEYCRKFYPKTVRVTPGKEVKIDDWRDAHNRGRYSSIKMAYNCRQK